MRTMSSDEEASVRKITDFDDEVDNFSILSTSPPRHNPSRRTTNTGPKGVRADARAYEAAKREAAANKTRKQSLLTTGSLGVSGESGSEASEDEWMSRWREKRMKELSKSGVAGVNCFGQVDDVDANGYLKAVDFDELEDDDEVVVDDYSAAAKRARARRNVVTVVLIWDSVLPPSFLLFVRSVLTWRVVDGFKEDVSGVFEACETVSYDPLSPIIGTIRRRYAFIRTPRRTRLPTRRVDLQPRALCRRTRPRLRNHHPHCRSILNKVAPYLLSSPNWS